MHVPKAPEIVASRIKKQIIAGTLNEGDLLQSESKLMEEYGVSRPTIREAFRILEAERLITVSRGARGGAVIHAPDPGLVASYMLLVLQSERTTIDEIFGARTLLEPPVVRMVAQTAAKTAPAILRERLAQETEVIENVPAFAAAVAEFHRTLVQLSGNKPLILLIETIHSVVARYQTMVMSMHRLGQASADVRSSMSVALKSHKKLIDMIERGDADAAELHWRKHMEVTQKTWITGYEGTPIHELFAD